MNNNTTDAIKKQERTQNENVNYFALDTVSLVAISPLTEAVFMLSGSPIQILSCLHKYLQFLYEQKREQESVDMLYIIYDVLGMHLTRGATR